MSILLLYMAGSNGIGALTLEFAYGMILESPTCSYRGLYLPAMMMIRDGIEMVAVIEYLYTKHENGSKETAVATGQKDLADTKNPGR